MTMSLLLPEEKAALMERRPLQIGPFHDPKRGARAFQVAVDAFFLAELIEDVSVSRRVYEFMSIQRPGELLAYLRVQWRPEDEELVQEIRRGLRFAPEPLTELAVTDMDPLFPWVGEDTTPLAEAWQLARGGAWWQAWLRELLALVRQVQARVRDTDDVLLRREVALMDAGQHRLDFAPVIRRQGRRHLPSTPTMPAPVANAVLALVRNLELPAVAAEEGSLTFWRELYALQMTRADAAGTPPMEALGLYASDGGVPLRPEPWGGEVFVSYEGMCMASLVVLPHWRRFNAEAACKHGALHRGLFHLPREPEVTLRNGCRSTRDTCLVLVCEQDFGDIDGTERLQLQGWSLYVSKRLMRPGESVAQLAEVSS